MKDSIFIVWPGAGYTGLTTAAELTLRGFRVRVVAAELGYRPPLTIVGTQVSIIIRAAMGLREIFGPSPW